MIRRDFLKTLTIITSKLFLPPVEKLIIPAATAPVFPAAVAGTVRVTVGPGGTFSSLAAMEAALKTKLGLKYCDLNALGSALEVTILPWCPLDPDGRWRFTGWRTSPERQLKVQGTDHRSETLVNIKREDGIFYLGSDNRSRVYSKQTRFSNLDVERHHFLKEQEPAYRIDVDNCSIYGSVADMSEDSPQQKKQSRVSFLKPAP